MTAVQCIGIESLCLAWAHRIQCFYRSLTLLLAYPDLILEGVLESRVSPVAGSQQNGPICGMKCPPDPGTSWFGSQVFVLVGLVWFGLLLVVSILSKLRPTGCQVCLAHYKRGCGVGVG